VVNGVENGRGGEGVFGSYYSFGIIIFFMELQGVENGRGGVYPTRE
jgi:hypothetical protein